MDHAKTAETGWPARSCRLTRHFSPRRRRPARSCRPAGHFIATAAPAEAPRPAAPAPPRLTEGGAAPEATPRPRQLRSPLGRSVTPPDRATKRPSAARLVSGHGAESTSEDNGSRVREERSRAQAEEAGCRGAQDRDLRNAAEGRGTPARAATAQRKAAARRDVSSRRPRPRRRPTAPAPPRLTEGGAAPTAAPRPRQLRSSLRQTCGAAPTGPRSAPRRHASVARGADHLRPRGAASDMGFNPKAEKLTWTRRQETAKQAKSADITPTQPTHARNRLWLGRKGV